MINISKNYKKFQFIWMRIMFFLAILYGLTMPGMIAADDGEKNYFTIYLNEAKIGATDSFDVEKEKIVFQEMIDAESKLTYLPNYKSNNPRNYDSRLPIS